MLGGILLNVLAFLGLRLFISFSTSDKPTSLKENRDSETASLIFKTLECAAYFFNANSIGSLMPSVMDRRYLFS